MGTEIVCFRCGVRPADDYGIRSIAREEEITPDEAAAEDGTYNPDTRTFACDRCYIAIGMPSSPVGWRAPARQAVPR